MQALPSPAVDQSVHAMGHSLGEHHKRRMRDTGEYTKISLVIAVLIMVAGGKYSPSALCGYILSYLALITSKSCSRGSSL